jgi:hypothetical protein
MDISPKSQKRLADVSVAPVNSKLNTSSLTVSVILRYGKLITASQLIRKSNPRIASVRSRADNNTTWSNFVPPIAKLVLDTFSY